MISKKQILLFVNNILLLHLASENTVIGAISLVGDVRGHHVGEVGALDDRLVSH